VVFFVENYFPYLVGNVYKYGMYKAKIIPKKAELPKTTKA